MTLIHHLRLEKLVCIDADDNHSQDELVLQILDVTSPVAVPKWISSVALATELPRDSNTQVPVITLNNGQEKSLRNQVLDVVDGVTKYRTQLTEVDRGPGAWIDPDDDIGSAELPLNVGTHEVNIKGPSSNYKLVYSVEDTVAKLLAQIESLKARINDLLSENATLDLVARFGKAWLAMVESHRQLLLKRVEDLLKFIAWQQDVINKKDQHIKDLRDALAACNAAVPPEPELPAAPELDKSVPGIDGIPVPPKPGNSSPFPPPPGQGIRAAQAFHFANELQELVSGIQKASGAVRSALRPLDLAPKAATPIEKTRPRPHGVHKHKDLPLQNTVPEA